MSHGLDAIVEFVWGVCGLAGIIFFLLIISAIGYNYGKTRGCKDGYKDGYTSALDDIRLGKTPKYKLVKIAEQWVEVEK